jgi:hypothetical protein
VTVTDTCLFLPCTYLPTSTGHVDKQQSVKCREEEKKHLIYLGLAHLSPSLLHVNIIMCKERKSTPSLLDFDVQDNQGKGNRKRLKKMESNILNFIPKFLCAPSHQNLISFLLTILPEFTQKRRLNETLNLLLKIAPPPSLVFSDLSKQAASPAPQTSVPESEGYDINNEPATTRQAADLHASVQKQFPAPSANLSANVQKQVLAPPSLPEREQLHKAATLPAPPSLLKREQVQ